MRSRNQLVASALMAVLAFTSISCSGGNQSNTGGKQTSEAGKSSTSGGNSELRAVVDKNLATTQSEDIDGLMETIHKDSPSRAATRDLMGKLFATYDGITYTVDEFVVDSETDSEAKATVTLITKKAKSDGPPFMDNKTRQQMTFRKQDGKWKVFDGKVLGIEYLQ